MAEVLGVNQTKFESPGNANWIDQGLIKSSLKIWTDEYEAAALPAADTIIVADLPEGAVVHAIDMQFDALGAATVDVGDSTDPNRYKNAVDVSSAGEDKSMLVDGAQYVIGTNTGDGRITLTTAAAAITGTIKTTVYYTN